MRLFFARARSGRYCRGCGRTLQEVRGWAKTTPFRRQALRRELARRVRKLAEQDG